MVLPTCLMPWQRWLEGSTQLGLSSISPYMWPLYHGGLWEIRLLIWRLGAPKVSVARNKTEAMFYDLASEDLECNFHNILLLNQDQIHREGNYTLPFNGRNSEEIPDTFNISHLYL